MLTVEEEVAVALVIDGIVNKSTKLGRGVLLDFGKVDGGTLTVREGRFGVYLNWKKVNAKLPKEYTDDPTGISKDEAWAAIEEKAAAGTAKGRAKKKVATAAKGKGKGKTKKPGMELNIDTTTTTTTHPILTRSFARRS